MKKLILAAVLVAGGTVYAVPALAQEDEPEQATEQVDPRRAPDAVRCESRPITGSRARRERICMTNAEWAEMRSNGNRDANRVIEDGTRIGWRGDE